MFGCEPELRLKVPTDVGLEGLEIYRELRIVVSDPVFWIELKTEDIKYIYQGTSLISGVEAFLRFTTSDEGISRVHLLLSREPHSGWEFHKLHAILKDSMGDFVFKVESGLRTIHNVEYTRDRSELNTLFWI